MQQGAATPVVKTRVLQYSYYYATPDTLPVSRAVHPGPRGRSMDDGAAMALRMPLISSRLTTDQSSAGLCTACRLQACISLPSSV